MSRDDLLRPCRCELSQLLFRPAADPRAVLEQCRTERVWVRACPWLRYACNSCVHHLTNRKWKSRQCPSTCRLCECPQTSHLVSPIPSPPLQAMRSGGGQHSTTTAQSMGSPCSCKARICSCFLSCSFISNNVVKWLNISKSPQASKSCREKLRCLGSYRNALRPRNCHIGRCVYLRNRP